MAVCGADDGAGGLQIDHLTPLDQCQYIIMDAADFAVWVSTPLSELYALEVAAFGLLFVVLGIMTGRQRSY